MTEWINEKDQHPMFNERVLVCCSASNLVEYFYTVSELMNTAESALAKNAIRNHGSPIVWKQELSCKGTKVLYWAYFDMIDDKRALEEMGK